MQKKRLILLIACVLVTNLTACSNRNSDNSKIPKKVTEYNIDDFGALYEETNILFEKESEYLTDEELYGSKGYAIYEKCSEETGLPFNETITLRGKKMSSTLGFLVSSADEEYSIYCFFNDDDPNTSLFIKNGENIVVSGIFSADADSYGCLTNVSIDLPENINIIYENNITEVLTDYENLSGTTLVQGEIELILSLEEFEQGMDLMNTTVTYEHQDYYYDTVVKLKDEERTIYFMYDQELFPNLKDGDKIAVQGYVNDLMHIIKADGTTEILCGIMGNIYDIYLF